MPEEQHHLKKGEWDFKAGEKMVHASLLEKVGLGLVLSTLPVKAAIEVPKWYFGGSNKKLSNYLQVELGKYVSSLTNIKQLRIIMRPQPLREFLQSSALKRVSQGVPNYNKLFEVSNASARWIYEVPDRQPSDPVILYLHGGAYMLTTMPQQIMWLLYSARRLSGLRVSILEVDYTVTPEGKWPTQLNETLAVYHELRKSCDKIITLGDSAGGHLALNLNDYLHTHNQPKPFGVVLVSPWADILPRYSGSYSANAKHDYINIDGYPGTLFATPQQLETPQANPCRGDAAYWQGKLDGNACCVWGEWEVLADCCEEISQKCGITDTFVEPKGLHDALILNPKNASGDFVTSCIYKWLAPDRPVPPIPVNTKL